MPDENRFAGLGEQMEGEETTSDVSGSGPESDTEPAEQSSGPAFEFDETTAKSIYVRPETLEVLEDTEFEVESILRREHDVRDLTGREFHDALVRAVANNPDTVVDLILDARGD